MADYPDDPDDLGDLDMADDHDHPDLDEDATGGVSPDILLMGLIRAMAAKLQDEDDDDEDNRRRRRPSRRNQNDDDDDVNRSVRLPPVVGKGKAASSAVASKMSYSTAARKQRPQLKQQPKQGRSSSSNTSQHKTPVSNADYEGGGGVTSLPMAAQRSQRAEVVKGKRGVGGGGGARPSTSNSPGSPVPAPATTSTTSTCCDLLTREVLTTTEQVTKQLEKNQADRLKVAKERAQLLTSFQAVTAQFIEVAKKNLEGKGAGEVPKSTTSNPPSGN